MNLRILIGMVLLGMIPGFDAASSYQQKKGRMNPVVLPAMVRELDYRIGQVSHEFVSALDILPTTAAATDVSLPTDRKLDGFDLMPMLVKQVDSSPRQESPRQEFVSYNGLTLEAVRMGPWKLHLPRKAVNLV
ncbi:hypothetical protein Q31b_32920 [Novipirellula aureliae]|uniref:Uncharacterized protein n=1 Tax=Novipirellula aureliae TaxID=2527966 RepID=A0A5C6DY38_9BACT|nr:hypothetical protein [Novipirellula aureliae]TWU39976.1 hypothetical protein Q31b_32920 [Novipirellula aureliae]